MILVSELLYTKIVLFCYRKGNTVNRTEIRRLGTLAEKLTREALEVIQAKRREGETQATMVKNPYVRSGYAPRTPADLPAQLVYTRALADAHPEAYIIAEEKSSDRQASRTKPRKNQPIWLIDGLDGSGNFSDPSLDFGYGTQCALLLPDGTVPIAFVGDATTGAIYGYSGEAGAPDAGVFQLSSSGRRSSIDQVDRRRPLSELPFLRRPPLQEYNELSQRVLKSDILGEFQPLVGGIGTTMAMLLTDEIGLFGLRPHHEQPWDAIPAYALCERAGMVFMTPHAGGFTQWKPRHRAETWVRSFDLLVMHKSRLPEFMAAVQR